MKYKIIILYILSSLVITDTIYYLTWMNVGFSTSTYLVAAITYISILLLIFIAAKSSFKEKTPLTISIIFILWLLVNLFGLVIGLFSAQNYWDWKFLFLSSVSFSAISLIFFIGNNLYLSKQSIIFVLKILFPFGYILIPITLLYSEQLYSRLMIPVSLFMIFIPYLRIKYKIIIIFVILTSILMAYGFRTNIIKVVFSLIFLFFYYYRNIFRTGWVNAVQISLFVLPVILLIFAISGKFNFFTEMEKTSGSSYKATKNGEEMDMFGDTRTFLFNEVFSSLNKSGHWIFGEGGSGSYKSIFFYDDGGAIKGRRYTTEIGMLNILLRNGFLGVIVYSLLLIVVSTIAINNSNNYLSKMLGLFIASRFLLSFIEEYSQYDLNFFFFWLVIGLVSSNRFRSMNDRQIKKYFLFSEKNYSRSSHMS